MMVNSGGQQRRQWHDGGVAAAVVPSPTSGRPGVVRRARAGSRVGQVERATLRRR